MKKKDDGFSTPLAMIVIFSLSVMILSFSLLVAANNRKLNSFKNFVLARKEAESILLALEKDFQALCNSPCDSDTASEICDILARYGKYGIVLEDVSTGIHKDFMSEEFYKNKTVREYIEVQGEPVFKEYGWLNPKYADKKFIDNISADFNEEKPFPIVNTFPLYNIHSMSYEFLEMIFEYCRIKEASKNAEKVIASLSSDTDTKKLSEILQIPETHFVFDFIGMKTAFWKVLLDTDRCHVSAVFAAVPKKEANRSVEKYILVDKKISYKRDSL